MNGLADTTVRFIGAPRGRLRVDRRVNQRSIWKGSRQPVVNFLLWYMFIGHSVLANRAFLYTGWAGGATTGEV